MKISLKSVALAVACSIASVGAANAHATSIGYENAGAGAVNVWLGTYNHSNHHLEGSLNLLGVNGNTFASTTTAFSLTAGSYPFVTSNGASKPSGLVDGLTNFYSPNACANGSAALVSTPNTCGGGVNHWAGVQFSGLTAGDYQFTWIPIANPSAEWSVLNTNFNGIFTLSGAVVNPNPPSPSPSAVPLPAALPLLGFGIGLLGFAGKRRRKA